ncbi:MAG TPA: hotdog domain-containing protein [Miltoncostaeaceae bacterium]|nr:hotdog domain-containing protein [Miltoncostaeaceae bacterium]
MTDPLPAAEPYVLSILVMPAQANTLGVMHGGHMMSWMDMAAWVVATRAVEAGQTVYFKAVHDCVWSGPIHAGEVCHVIARLAEIGTSSLRVRLEALAEDPVRKETRGVCRAVFTMVAAEDGVAVPVRLHAAGGWAGGPPPTVAQSG